MQKILFAGFILAILAPAAASPAAAITFEQAKAECMRQYGGTAGTAAALRQAERTGVTPSQAVTQCVRQKMGQNKKN